MTATEAQKTTKKRAGIVVPMVTPFTPTGDLDEAAARRIVDHILEADVGGVFLLGTTGEDASMSLEMRTRLVATVTEHVGGRATTYAGISHNSLASSVKAAEAYTRLGVDTLVARLPTYYALTDEEQHAYFLALLERIPGPLMLYNITSTTHMTIPIRVIEALSQHSQVVGIKDSDRDLPRLEELVRRLGGRPDFSLLCGVTAWSVRALALGADGCVPSTANLVPEACQRLYERFCQGDLAAAEACQRELDELGGILRAGQTLGQSIGSLKAAMGALGLCGPTVLPPLTTPSLSQQEAARNGLRLWQAERERH